MISEQTGPFEIFFQDFAPSAATQTYAAERYQKLAHHHERINQGRMVVAKATGGHSKGGTYEVTLTLDVPGIGTVVDHHHTDDATAKALHIAIRDAFATADRKLNDSVKRMSGAGQRHRHARTRADKRLSEK